jgi:hypothetical protein
MYGLFMHFMPILLNPHSQMQLKRVAYRKRAHDLWAGVAFVRWRMCRTVGNWQHEVHAEPIFRERLRGARSRDLIC